MPHFAADFHAVRSNLGLEASRALPPAPPPPYSKECSCACTCGALPGGTVGEAHVHTHDGTPTDTPVHTPGLGDSPIGPLGGPAPGSPSGSDTSLPRALSPTADLVVCALTSGSPLCGLTSSSAVGIDIRTSTPTIPHLNPNPTPRPYWLRGGGRNRSHSVQALSATHSLTGLALHSQSTTNLALPMSVSTTAER